jgi:osmotically-inducible protein OsmY
MNISSKRHNLIIGAYLVLLAGLGGIATQAVAQNASVAASATQTANQSADEELMNRVKTALHDNPSLDDAHVTVSVEKGSIVLDGFVLDSQDLIDALRVARKAAGNARVVDNLSIIDLRRR